MAKEPKSPKQSVIKITQRDMRALCKLLVKSELSVSWIEVYNLKFISAKTTSSTLTVYWLLAIRLCW